MKWGFQGDLLARMEAFEREVRDYERHLGQPIQDDLKIGIVMNNILEGPARTHLLLNSERLDT